jgi:membrane protein DedA with SNARE-associated domain
MGFIGDVLAWFGGALGFIDSVLQAILTWVLDTVHALGPVPRTLFAGVGILLETSILVGLIIPGDTIVIIASTAVSSPLEYFALILAVILGAFLGESIGFALGKFFGPRIRASRLGQRLGERNWVRAENYLDRRGGIAVFISRFLPVLHSLIPLTVGMSTMRYRKFMAWTLPACAIWATAYVTAGSVVGGSYRQLADRLHGAGYIFVAAVAAIAIVAYFIKKRIERAERRHMETPGDGDANTIDPVIEPR